MSYVCHAFPSGHCSVVVTCWERADLLALVCEVELCLVTFPCGILDQVWYLIVPIPDFCRLSYFPYISVKICLTHKTVINCRYARHNRMVFTIKIVNEYDQEIPQSQTVDNPAAPRGWAAQPPRDTRETNQAKQSAPSSPSRWLQY